ncbi:MAG: Asp-tRNA(Asn)/Glu-tRNA(Gln) amidotransferase subunit GatA [Chitinophagales bacterium]
MFEFSSIEQYHADLKEEKLTCLQAVEYYLTQIQSKQRLNAFIEVYAGEALQKAKDLDKKRKSGAATGRLHGVIIGLKDIICYKDHPISASSNILKSRIVDSSQADSFGHADEQGFVSVYSATVVERLLAEEAIIIGNLNCDEFAMGSTNENSAYGRVLNARDETRVSGGSSGGSAVAVQAGLCMLSLGTDTGGSVRQPADFCGVIGFKPTYGRISRYGLIAYASSFDQIGIFGTSIPDIAKILEIIAGHDQFDSTLSSRKVDTYSGQDPDNKRYRIAYFPEALDHPSLDPEIARSIRDRIDELVQQGHTVEPVHFDLLDYIVPAYYILTTAEASSNLSRYDGVKYGYRTESRGIELTELYKKTRSRGFGTEVKRRIMLGTFVLSAGYYDAYFTQAQKVRKLLTEKINLIFNDYDFIILPTSPSVAFKSGEMTQDPIAMYLADIYTVMANLVGIPAISVPIFQHKISGMPFGLQVLSCRFNELPLLRFSNQLMQGH